MSTWHYLNNGAQAGPVSTDELRALISTNAIRPNTLVWRQGMTTWLAADTLTEFAGAAPIPTQIPVAPPPTPTSPTTLAASAGTSTSEKPVEEIPDPVDVEKNKVFGVIAYLPPLLFLVPLLAARQSRFAMYHCNQGLVLTIVAIALSVVLMILGIALGAIPVVGFFLILMLGMIKWIGFLALAIIGVINAANGRCKPLPLIGGHFTLVK